MKAWVLRHGKIMEVNELKRISPQTVEVFVGEKCYSVNFNEIQEKHSHLVVFDGVLLPHGLSRSVRFLPSHSEQGMFDGDSPEMLTARSPAAKVRRDSGLPVGMKRLGNRMVGYRTKGVDTEVTFARWFLSVQKGNGTRTLAFRYKEVSLEMSYICIESYATEVKFVTLNNW